MPVHINDQKLVKRTYVCTGCKAYKAFEVKEGTHIGYAPENCEECRSPLARDRDISDVEVKA